MLSGRLAWVTGAGGGIGREICRILALEGANVVVDDIEQSKCLETITVSISLLVNLELRKNFDRKIQSYIAFTFSYFSRY